LSDTLYFNSENGDLHDTDKILNYDHIM